MHSLFVYHVSETMTVANDILIAEWGNTCLYMLKFAATKWHYLLHYA